MKNEAHLKKEKNVFGTFNLKAGSHYATNLWQPAIDCCELETFSAATCGPLQQLQQPATIVNKTSLNIQKQHSHGARVGVNNQLKSYF